VVAPRPPPRDDGGQRSCLTIRQSPWVTTIMTTTRNSVTRQRFESSESAASQGGKAGPQASSSSNRSSTSVGNLAFVEPTVTSQSSSCMNIVNNFCVVCGEYIPQAKKLVFSDLFKKRYNECFDINTNTLDNIWTPKSICSRCRNVLNKSRKQIFSRPMIWRKPTNHTSECYFCLTNVIGYNRANRHSISYACCTSVTFPVYIDAKTNEDHSMDANDEASIDEVSADSITVDDRNDR